MSENYHLSSMILELRTLNATAPDLERCDLAVEDTQNWLARAKKAVRAVAGPDEAKAYQLYIDRLHDPKLRFSKAMALRSIIPRNIDRAERRLVFINQQKAHDAA